MSIKRRQTSNSPRKCAHRTCHWQHGVRSFSWCRHQTNIYNRFRQQCSAYKRTSKREWSLQTYSHRVRSLWDANTATASDKPIVWAARLYRGLFDGILRSSKSTRPEEHQVWANKGFLENQRPSSPSFFKTGTAKDDWLARWPYSWIGRPIRADKKSIYQQTRRDTILSRPPYSESYIE